MRDAKTDKEPVVSAADRGESVGLMEPLLVRESSNHRTELTDLAIELASRSAGFRRSLPEGVLTALADLVRAMNCYYSNLIEGHDTHPVDIERALKNEYSADPRTRNLQLEAKAHITVQQWIDQGGLKGRATSTEGICEIHRRFCELLPEDLMWLEEPETGERIKVVAGELRHRDVKVGRHIPVSPGALPRFLNRFEHVYSNLGKTDAILAAATAHHRLLWIHPFLDGNGRVARLMSHAMLLETLDTGGVWSIARGLARNESTYKSQLMACDAQRRNDLDGRGHLSEEALAEFTALFPDHLYRPDPIHGRPRAAQALARSHPDLDRGRNPCRRPAAQIRHRPRSGPLSWRTATRRGCLPTWRKRPPGTARYIIAGRSRGPRFGKLARAIAPYLPAKLASRWMPGLFPEQRP